MELCTYGEIIPEKYLTLYLRHPNASKIFFVNDLYDLDIITIKDSERERRADSHTDRNVFMKSDNKFPSSRDFSNMFTSNGNKQRLQKFLKEEFQIFSTEYPNIEFYYSTRNVCINLSTGAKMADYECLHIEADTILLYMYSQLRKSGLRDVVVLDAEDTDVPTCIATASGLLALGRGEPNNILICSLSISK